MLTNHRQSLVQLGQHRLKLTSAFVALAFFVSGSTALAHPSDHHTEAEILQQAGGPEDLQDLNKQIGDKKKAIEDIEKEQEQLEKDIEAAQAEGASLRSRIAELNGEIDQRLLSIQKTETEIGRTELEIDYVHEEIHIQESNIARSKRLLAELLRQLHKSDQTSSLEILLANDSLSTFLDDRKGIEALEQETQVTLRAFSDLVVLLQEQEAELAAKQDELTELKGRLDSERTILSQERSGQETILAQTEEQEEAFQELLERAKQEQQAAESEVASLEAEAQKRIAEQKRSDPEFEFTPGDGTLAWPVSPNYGITAYFDDAAYIRYFGVPHGAVDVATPQNTPIRAPADAYVVTYRDAGLGYSYILLSHGNGLSTLYGHIPTSYVSAGQTVKAGDVIGLTGGMPGTRGAGLRTTGPHLHFEVRVNGIKKDPLLYLP